MFPKLQHRDHQVGLPDISDAGNSEVAIEPVMCFHQDTSKHLAAGAELIEIRAVKIFQNSWDGGYD